MKYAREVIELLAPFPGREFRMAEIIRYIGPRATGTDRMRVHKGVLRVLAHLIEQGNVEHCTPGVGRGEISTYAWVMSSPNAASPGVELRHLQVAN